MEKSTEAITERIRRILAIAENGAASPNEIAVAMTLAQRLMMQYNLSRADILTKDSDEFYDIHNENVGRDYWRALLLHNLATALHCMTVHNKKNHYSAVIGDKETVRVVLQIFYSVETQLIALNKTFWEKTEIALSRYKWNKAFYAGAIETIARRMNREQEEFEAHNNCTALIVVNDEKIKKTIEASFGETIKSKPKKYYDSAFEIGMKAGNHVALQAVIGE